VVTTYETERRSQRRQLDVAIRIQRQDGSVAEGRCVDASDEGFGVSADVTLETGESVRLTIGRSAKAPTFIARVVWQHESRIGLYCESSEDK
jgi:hypothetical protein